MLIQCSRVVPLTLINFVYMGAFTIYVYNFSPIFDHPPTYVYNSYAINIYKFIRFLTTHPPSIVNVICGPPLR